MAQWSFGECLDTKVTGLIPGGGTFYFSSCGSPLVIIYFTMSANADIDINLNGGRKQQQLLQEIGFSLFFVRIFSVLYSLGQWPSSEQLKVSRLSM